MAFTIDPTKSKGAATDLMLGSAGLDIAGGILGFENANDTANENSAIALLNYNAKMTDAKNELLIGSLNAANATKDAASLQKQWGWQSEAFAENSQVIEASNAYKKQGLVLEEERVLGKQAATFGMSGVAVGVGTPVAQQQIAKEMFGRQIGALEQEREQSELGNALKATMTAGEFQAQIEHYKGEAQVYQTEASSKAQSDYAQANILYQEGMAKSAQDSASGVGALLGGVEKAVRTGASIAELI
jgi:hypothetical protein